jgi:pimeloyl-ACP methyl ester carboxylesterase
VSVLGHSYGGIGALEAALLTHRVRALVLYEPAPGISTTPPEVVERLEALHETGELDALVALFMQDVAGLPPGQVELLRSLPALEARLGTAGTIPREERAAREYRFDADRFRELRVPTLFLEGGDSPDPFRKAGEVVHAALPDCEIVVMPGQRHAAMDTATPSSSQQRCWPSYNPIGPRSRSATAPRARATRESGDPALGRRGSSARGNLASSL